MSAVHSFVHEVQLETVSCCSCGVLFAMPSSLKRRLKEDGGWFYCPSGHQQHYTKTEIDRLKEKLDEQIRIATSMTARATAAEQAEHKAASEAARLRRRLKAGVCPCCNRTFQQLARHMKTKHSDMLVNSHLDVKDGE